jgi:hypothetical protein
MCRTFVFLILIASLTFFFEACNWETNSRNRSEQEDSEITPSAPIPVLEANSEKENDYLNTPFVGITSDGEVQKDLYTIQPTNVAVDEIKNAVNAFLSSLDEKQLQSCTFKVDDDEWRRWHNIESYEREGIAIFELNEHQKELAFDILNASMSAEGVTKAQSIMLMEAYLKEVSTRVGNGNNMPLHMLGTDKYWFSFMGTPSDTEPWGWQIDGHHLVVNYFVLGDQVVMTPTFMGSELTYIGDGPEKGVKTFVEEGNKGLALLHSLNDNQKQKAILLEEKKFSYAKAEAFKDNETIPFTGISAQSFTSLQTELLVDLIEEYIGNMRPQHAEIKMTEVQKHLPETWFSWIGGTTEDAVFYYQIHSPVLLIEYDHHSPVFVVKPGETANDPVNWHVHTVVRTPNGNDYGKDLLRQHLSKHHSHD